MNKLTFFLFLFLILSICSDVSGETIYIPDNYPTIQAGIEAAQNGDTVIVAPETYYENIDFRGKSITVMSQTGPDNTLIDGGQGGSVVTFWSEEDNSAVLQGFTVKNGLPPFSLPFGGGITIRNASPTITGCRIETNGATNGGGVFVEGHKSSPIIENNLISNNIGTETGGGIETRDGASPIIRNNVITENMAMNGSGIFVSNGSAPLIEGNTIQNNEGGCDMSYPEDAQKHLNGIDVAENLACGDTFPNAIFVADRCAPVIRNNNVTENIGGGMSILLGSSPVIEDNIISDNSGGYLLTGGILIALDSAPILTGNTIEGNQAGAIWIDDTSSILDEGQRPISLEGFYIIEDSEETFDYFPPWDLGLGKIYSGGTRRASGGTVGAVASVSFTGTGVSLIYFSFKNTGGIAAIEIDGITYPSIDTYSADKRRNGKTEKLIATDLSPTEHILTITATGDKNPMSSFFGIVVDAVGVLSRTSVGDNRIFGSVYSPPQSPQHTAKGLSGKTLWVPDNHSTIQDAIQTANNGDTIIVAPGSYQENIDFLGKRISLRSQNPDDKEIVRSTIIEAKDQESPTVIFARGETRQTKVEGFTIRNRLGGKAIYVGSSSPVIKGNIIRDSAKGGITCDYADSPLITNNIIENNAVTSGSGIDCYLSSPEIENNMITDNSGSGIGSYFSMPIIFSNIISSNTRNEGQESGIFLDHLSIATVIGNTISENKTDTFNIGANGIYLDFFSNSIIDGNMITDNQGRGIFMILDCSPMIKNNIIARNYAGLNISLSRPVLINNTIAHNTNTGIRVANFADIVITNTILSNAYGEINLIEYSKAIVTYSLVEDGWEGEGNISLDPLFVGGGDYHLRKGSPCIDAGTSENAPSYDIDGDSRLQGEAYDIGADEFKLKVIVLPSVLLLLLD